MLTPSSPPAVSDANIPSLPWQLHYQQLGSTFGMPCLPTPVTSPSMLAWSNDVAALLDPTSGLTPTAALGMFSGNAIAPGSEPFASVYSGHQFGVWAGQLGDGRALLLGELNGYEVQLKGSGPTPYSRRGDGRAVLRSSIREFLASEAMHALNIPTTRALCLVGATTPVQRETLETAALLTRTAPSFLRFGHFEHFYAHRDFESLQQLMDYTIERYDPQARLRQNTPGNTEAQWLHGVALKTAELVAHWQSIGFCHGVLNTDNMSVLGLTLDYGPFQFIDAFDPEHVGNHSDHQGRYAFGQQPSIGYWNLLRLGQAVQPLIGAPEDAQTAVDAYKSHFHDTLMLRLRSKLGFTAPFDGDASLITDLLQLLTDWRIDHTIFWRRLSHAISGQSMAAVDSLWEQTADWNSWLLRYEKLQRLYSSEFSPDLMLKTNPAYILRNHLAEQAIQAAQQGDLSVLHRLHRALAQPFDDNPEFADLADFPPSWASNLCISCSS